MLEIDRIYHANETSEARINCIADYVRRLLAPAEVCECGHEVASHTAGGCYYVIDDAEYLYCPCEKLRVK